MGRSGRHDARGAPLIAWLATSALAADLLITDVRLWDGTGAPVRVVDIRIAGDRVVAIGELAPNGERVLDGAGATVIPGLIDAHVHVSMDPGAAYRDATAEAHRDLLGTHLRAYLACGFTTILDPAVLPDELALVREALEAGPGPRYLTLGEPFAPPGGYPAAVIEGFPVVATPADVEAQLDRAVAAGAVGIKTTVEEGFGASRWPLYSDEVARAIVDGAARRGLPIYAHAMAPDEQRRALEQLRPHALVHPPERPDRRLAEQVAASGAYEMTTLSALEAMRIGREPERLGDPLVRLTVPEVELATARDRDVERAFGRTMVGTLYPRMPAKGLVGRIGLSKAVVGPRVRRMQRALRQLADAGVPVVLGSDSGNWPVIPYLFHGPTSVRELELLGQAGFTPEEALVAATRTPARMLGIEAGTVEVGRVADLVVVEGDPLTDLSALRDIRWTVRAGEARTPEEWMR